MNAWDELAERFHELFGERVSGAELRRRHIEEGSMMSESTDPAAAGPQGASGEPLTPSQVVPAPSSPAGSPLAPPDERPGAGPIWPQAGYYGGRYWTGSSWQDFTTGAPAATPERLPGHEGPALPFGSANPEQADTAPDTAPELAYDGPGLGAGVVATVGGSPAAGILVGEPDENGDASVLVYQRGVGFHEYALTFDTTQGEDSPDGTYRAIQ